MTANKAVDVVPTLAPMIAAAAASMPMTDCVAAVRMMAMAAL
jgi:hypothetical protein